MINLGIISIQSWAGAYVQAHQDNGEMHASNDSRGTEETWFLIEIDNANHIYAFQNWSNGRYMSRKPNGCVWADSEVLGPTEQWVLRSGVPFNILNAVSIVSLNNYTLGANRPGDNTACGGEIGDFGQVPPQGYSSWAGWFSILGCQPPEPGNSPWNIIGEIFNGIQVVVGICNTAMVIAGL